MYFEPQVSVLTINLLFFRDMVLIVHGFPNDISALRVRSCMNVYIVYTCALPKIYLEHILTYGPPGTYFSKYLRMMRGIEF